MIDERPLSADRVPTLTEVVEIGPAMAMAIGAAAPDAAAPVEVADEAAGAGAEAAALPPDGDPGAGFAAEPGAPAIDAHADAIVGQVLAELLPRIDMLLESRLREALAPALARAADALILDTRQHLALAMRDLVQDAVQRALQRRAAP